MTDEVRNVFESGGDELEDGKLQQGVRDGVGDASDNNKGLYAEYAEALAAAIMQIGEVLPLAGDCEQDSIVCRSPTGTVDIGAFQTLSEKRRRELRSVRFGQDSRSRSRSRSRSPFARHMQKLFGTWRCRAKGIEQYHVVGRHHHRGCCETWERATPGREWKCRLFPIRPSSDGRRVLWGHTGNVSLDLDSLTSTTAIWRSATNQKNWIWRR